ncbi:hypothetical protein [Arthrobacter sp. L77]|uniref:hypothetical protein n=1 Tax=Arthrobacter sp. L77 TaxID=1496689 RepID=UPI000A76361E|nr:hypothetical protein [Arthrobacter sp. L77]
MEEDTIPPPVVRAHPEAEATMLKITKDRPSAPDHSEGRKRTGLARKIVGGFFLFTGGVHLGIVMADPQLYASFAQESFLPLIEKAWNEIFMAAPARWGLALAAGEATLGVLLLRGGQWAKAGWIGVIAFHVGLMLFGWGFWLWSVPALAVLIWAARADWRSLQA